MEIEAKIKLTKEEADDLKKRMFYIHGLEYGNDPFHCFEVNDCYDRNRELEKEGEILRVRHEYNVMAPGLAPVMVFTFKGKTMKAKYKTCEEHNVELDAEEGEQMVTIFKALGYEKFFEYQKFRSHCELDGCTVCVDELPYIGHFIEVEGPNHREIEKVLARFDLENRLSITQGYRRLLKEYMVDHPGEIGDFSRIRFPAKVTEPYLGG